MKCEAVYEESRYRPATSIAIRLQTRRIGVRMGVRWVYIVDGCGPTLMQRLEKQQPFTEIHLIWLNGESQIDVYRGDRYQTRAQELEDGAQYL